MVTNSPKVFNTVCPSTQNFTQPLAVWSFLFATLSRVQCITECSTPQYSVLQCSALQCSRVQYITVYRSTVQALKTTTILKEHSLCQSKVYNNNKTQKLSYELQKLKTKSSLKKWPKCPHPPKKKYHNTKFSKETV